MNIRLLFLLVTSGLLTGSTRGWAQAPSLGTASSFGLFAATGALTNVGSSTVVGDVGFNTGSFSGFNTATITGQQHLGDPFSTTVAVDVVTAYNALVATPCGTVLASPELGSQTLTSGVYCQITALPTTLTGTLTLSGPGVFIFKLSSALTTADLSSIVLTNGATANNVYFQILGAATIGVPAGIGATFVGTILAMGAITLNNNTTLEGRALSTVGAISLIHSLVRVPMAPMPVALVSFTAKAQPNHTVDVAWTTSLETNNKGFVVERSKDLKLFEPVGEVGEVAPNSSALKTYHLVDQTPYQGTSYYRLRQTDLSDKATLYPAVSVVLRDEAYGVFPNPVLTDGRFSLRLDEPQTAAVRFYGVDGRPLLLDKTGVEAGNLLLKPTGKLAAGVYVLTVEERGTLRRHRLVVQ